MAFAVVLKRAFTVVLVLVGVVVVVFAGLGVSNVFGFNPFAKSEIDRSQPVLLKSVVELSEYHAAEGNFEVVVDVQDNADWLPDFLTGRRTLFIGAGSVDAYVDLSKLAEGDLTLSADGTTATIRLPEAELDKPSLDVDRSSVFMQSRGAFDLVADVLSTPQQAKFYQLAEAKLATAAEASELRTRATENTKSMLTGMFGALGIAVEFEAAP